MVLRKVSGLYQNGEKDCNIFTLKARRQNQEQKKHISLFDFSYAASGVFTAKIRIIPAARTKAATYRPPEKEPVVSFTHPVKKGATQELRKPMRLARPNVVPTIPLGASSPNSA